MRLKTKMAEFRAKKGIDQGMLADAVDVSKTTICRLENGRYNPSLKLAYDIAKYFNTTIEEIFEFDENEEPKPIREYKRNK